MATSLNQRVFEANLRHSMYLQRYSTTVAKQAVALVNRVEQDILARLEKDDLTKLGRRRQEALLDRIRAISKEGFKPVKVLVNSQASALAAQEAAFQVKMIQQLAPVSLDLVTPDPRQLAAAVKARPFQGRFLRDWLKDVDDAAARRVRDAIRLGFVEGQTTEQVARAIRGTRAAKYTDGITQISRRSTLAMTRTALNHTANVARSETYKDNSDIIKGVRWTATLDGRTSLVCGSRDGRVFPVDKGPRPPAHVNCRSSTSPVVKSWKELGINLKQAPEGTRASLDGQVPASTTFEGFLKQQPAKFQDEFLGPSQGRLFRQGKLPLRKFIDNSGKPLTLDQLRLKEPEAWKAAGL